MLRLCGRVTPTSGAVRAMRAMHGRTVTTVTSQMAGPYCQDPATVDAVYFNVGQPSQDLLPLKEIQECSQAWAAKETDPLILQYANEQVCGQSVLPCCNIRMGRYRVLTPSTGAHVAVCLHCRVAHAGKPPLPDASGRHA
jgi:hypothetical protein